LYVVYPAELVSITLLEIFPAGFPIFGRVAFTVGTTLLIVSAILQNIAITTSFFTLAYATSPEEITNFLAAHNAPAALIFLPNAVLRFASIFQRETIAVVNAQRLRGWTAGHPLRNPALYAASYIPLLNPLCQLGVRTLNTLTWGLEIRGFGSGRMSPAVETKMSASDKAITIAVSALTAICAIGLFVYNLGRL